jgi:hypothetical protein
MSKTILYAGEIVTRYQAAKAAGISYYAVNKILEGKGIDDSQTDCFPYLNQDNWQRMSKSSIGTTYLFKGKPMTASEISQFVAISLQHVGNVLKSNQAKKNDRVDRLFESYPVSSAPVLKSVTSRPLVHEVTRIGYLFLGEHHTSSSIAKMLKLKTASVNIAINRAYPFKKRVAQYMNGNRKPIDVTDVFCWLHTPQNSKVSFFGRHKKQAYYSYDGQVLTLEGIKHQTGLSHHQVTKVLLSNMTKVA